MEKSKTDKRIIVVGAVAAGTSAAAKARRNDESAQIVIYDLDDKISYSGCGLPYFIGGLVPDIAALTPRDPDFFKKRCNVDVKISHEVTGVDPLNKTVSVKDLTTGNIFEDRYDILVLATGARPVRLPIEGSDKDHVFVLRNPGHAAAIRGFMDNQRPRKAAVIGSGFIGLEMVENLSHAGLEISLVEMLPQVCPFIDPDMAVHVEKHLKDNKVAIYTGRKAVRILDDKVVLDNGVKIAADLVIMAVGIRPNTELAESIGINLGAGGSIAVDNSMQTNIPGIYACGDCAESFSVVDGRKIYRPLGSTANKMGRITGDVITGGSLRFRGITGTGIFRVFEMAVAACGLQESEARQSGYDVVVSHNTKPDKPAYFGGREMTIKTIADRASEKILGVQITGFSGVDKRIDVFVTAITAGLKTSDLFHLDLAYAPPFSTTKDPVMYSGMILDNVINHDRPLITAGDLSNLNPADIQIIDARSVEQYAKSHVENAINIPHAELRRNIESLDKNKPVITYCNKGVTGNAAQNILKNMGFKEVYCLSGGHKQYASCLCLNKQGKSADK